MYLRKKRVQGKKSKTKLWHVFFILWLSGSVGGALFAHGLMALQYENWEGFILFPYTIAWLLLIVAPVSYLHAFYDEKSIERELDQSGLP